MFKLSSQSGPKFLKRDKRMIYLNEKAAIKYLFCRAKCNTQVLDGTDSANFQEIGLMGESSEDDLLLVEDFYIPKQEVNTATTEFDDEEWSLHTQRIRDEYLDEFTPPGEVPSQEVMESSQEYLNRFTKIWCHTHPHASASPSGTDDDTFKKFFDHEHCVFGSMIILASNNKVSNRMKYQSMIGPRISEEGVSVQFENGELMDLEKYADSWKNMHEIISNSRSFGFNISVADCTVFEDYSDLYPEWLEEIKENVSIKKYEQPKTSNHLYVGNSYNYKGHHTNNNSKLEGSLKDMLKKEANRWVGGLI